MITDFHTHIFPDKLAPVALQKLSDMSDMKYYTNGTLTGLQKSMEQAGIERSVILPIATTPRQTETINRTAIEMNEKFSDGSIVSLGSIHPDNTNYGEILRGLAENGIKGIKLHPLFQEIYFDDIKIKRIVYAAAENNLLVVTHAGFDISFPGKDLVTPERIHTVIRDVGNPKMVLAHLGGWCCWDDVERLLVGENVYFDTAFSITPVRTKEGKSIYNLKKEQFIRIIKNHGAEKILLGSDSPWSDQRESMEVLKECDFTSDELDMMLSGNADKLLG